MIKGLYIHIPFCSQICSYCDFAKQVAKPKRIEEYMKVLKEELKHYKNNYGSLETIYIGGGTPTSINMNLLDDFLKEINSLIDMSLIKEFSIESNPNDITNELVEILLKNNVNRISMGVQTINPASLKILNRNHSLEDVQKAITILRNNNFQNINLDFIYGIPNQTREDVLNDLDFIAKVKPKHISYYSLILEEKTVLEYQIAKGIIKALDDDLAADYSDLIKDYLVKESYIHYETSNYSLKDYKSIHNLIYWNLEEYLGIGLNAASQYNNHRYKNQYSITKYLKDFKERTEEDFNPELEFILMGLRKTKGINILEFKQRFNNDIFELYPALQKHLNNNLLKIDNNQLSFTELGSDLANQVYVDLI